jgi:hypothetical protein
MSRFRRDINLIVVYFLYCVMLHTYGVLGSGNSTDQVKMAGNYWCKWGISIDVEVVAAYL